MTDFDKVKDAVSVKSYANRFLEKCGSSYVCPKCGSGTGKKKTPAFSIMRDGKKWTCFSCSSSGDVFDLAGIVENTDDKAKQLQAVARVAGISIQAGCQTSQPRTPKNPVERKSPDFSKGIAKHRDYIARMAANVEHPDCVSYLEGRGFTVDQAKEWGFGYDPAKKRLVIPYPGSDCYHIDRDVTGTASNDKYKALPSSEVGGVPVFNPAALDSDVLVMVEGQLDAYAVMASGFAAMAVGTSQHRKALDLMHARGYQGNVLVLLDDDDPGRKASRSLVGELEASGIPCREIVLDGWNDPAEAYKADRDALASFLKAESQKITEAAQKAREEAYEDALRSLRVLNPVDVAQRVFLLEGAAEPVSTGFDKLDEVLGGGLYPGLCVLGAVSSLGKTTLTLQIADHIAGSGVPVLFVTIEQSAQELVAKSLSRLMFAAPGGGWVKRSARDVASARSRATWSESETKRLLEASQFYSETIAPNLRILEGRKQPSVCDVRTVAETMAKMNGRPPVVFIDYLQLLAPEDDRLSDKAATDRNVMELRQLARDLGTPVFVISSLNRSSYAGVVALDSFKESGSVEYGADVLLGLQPEGMADKLDGVRESESKKAAAKIMRDAKGEEERACEIVVLKQRNGATPKSGLPFLFRSGCSMFVES